MPAVFNRPLKTLVFQNDMMIMLENTDGIDYEAIDAFLKKYNAGINDAVQIGPHFKIDLRSMEFIITGHQLKGALLVSEFSVQTYYIPIMFPVDRVIETVFYFYHMAKAEH